MKPAALAACPPRLPQTLRGMGESEANVKKYVALHTRDASVSPHLKLERFFTDISPGSRPVAERVAQALAGYNDGCLQMYKGLLQGRVCASSIFVAVRRAVGAVAAAIVAFTHESTVRAAAGVVTYARYLRT